MVGFIRNQCFLTLQQSTLLAQLFLPSTHLVLWQLQGEVPVQTHFPPSRRLSLPIAHLLKKYLFGRQDDPDTQVRDASF